MGLATIVSAPWPTAIWSKRPMAVAMAAALAIALAVAAPTGPLVLLNRSPSEPPGLYVRTQDRARPGAIVAFKTPAAAFPYADHRLAFLHTRPILKVIAAGPGDTVCTGPTGLLINGTWRAPIAVVDAEGRALPRWRGCGVLGPDALFVFSSRVPNSFDSRYFGPVPRAAVIGVYKLAAPL